MNDSMTVIKIPGDQPNSHLFSYCPKCGDKNFVPVDRKSFACRSCQFLFFINCAAAAIGLIVTRDHKVCVTRRKNHPARNMLDFPGGFADPGESIETCLKREINEELNLSVTSMNYLFSTPNTYEYAGVVYDITDFVFHCQVTGLGAVKALDDVKEVLFISVDKLDGELFGLGSARTVIDWLGTDEARKMLVTS